MLFLKSTKLDVKSASEKWKALSKEQKDEINKKALEYPPINNREDIPRSYYNQIRQIQLDLAEEWKFNETGSNFALQFTVYCPILESIDEIHFSDCFNCCFADSVAIAITFTFTNADHTFSITANDDISASVGKPAFIGSSPCPTSNRGLKELKSGHDDSLLNFISFLSVDLDASTDERIGQHTGERVLYQQSKTDQVQIVFEKALDKLNIPGVLPHAMDIWKKASKKVYKSTPARKMFIAGCIVIASREQKKQTRLENILQPSPEYMKLLLHVVKLTKRALNYKASLNISEDVRSSVQILLTRVGQIANDSIKASEAVRSTLSSVKFHSLRQIAHNLLEIAINSGYLKKRYRANPIALSIIVLAVESQITKLATDVKVDMIETLSMSLDKVSMQTVNANLLDMLNLLRKITKVYMPWLEDEITARNKDKVGARIHRHRYNSFIWIADVAKYAKNANLSLGYEFADDTKVRTDRNTSAFVRSAIQFVRDNQEGTISASLSEELIESIKQEFMPSYSHSKALKRLGDKNVDNASDDELFSDEELASYIRTEDEVIAKQLAVGGMYDYQSKSKRRVVDKSEKRQKSNKTTAPVEEHEIEEIVGSIDPTSLYEEVASLIDT
ncbi:hypothetical protein E3Q06_00874 [Wallemia mellicola]|nr:hypothetical protein E3Q21_00847 [Wallemia mellicola]TIB91387.1 hypothetical protein E3Q20_00833 [Wallemia mellicola]TIC36810.1 hypothetical protein E3Q09_01124 [Wallemia mellicola]TIC42800.1 hypothetical protein E3Q07_00871 [Wallemia mellicola]TIC51671.1 hypothetical protein E3Q06_00874 [Wallemia mellicola]